MNKQVTATNSMSNCPLVTMRSLQQACLTFRAGQVRDSVHNWEKLCGSVVLDAVKHYRIEFATDCPRQTKMPKQIVFSPQETEVIESEISKYTAKHIIEPTSADSCGFVSIIFIRPKMDGSYRMIHVERHVLSVHLFAQWAFQCS